MPATPSMLSHQQTSFMVFSDHHTWCISCSAYIVFGFCILPNLQPFCITLQSAKQAVSKYLLVGQIRGYENGRKGLYHKERKARKVEKFEKSPRHKSNFKGRVQKEEGGIVQVTCFW